MVESSSMTSPADIAIPGQTPAYRGKVRDIYDLGDRLLIVATDRISAYDVVLPTAIPGKGAILTRMSAFWFETLGAVGEHHLLSIDPADFPSPFREQADALGGRAMYVRRTERVDFECVVRGYLAGSGWREYSATGRVCGIALPPGLRESDRLETPIFTPATKAETGHDENVSYETMAAAIGEGLASTLRDRSLAIYEEARRYAEARGILIADTKIEFGLLDRRPIVIDELLTPDSSRFWPADAYVPGRAQTAFDKQYVRDHLDASGWDHTPPAPALPPEVVERTGARYREALDRLTSTGESSS
jgi:phosphoribosylaminoimidazole-succinocarboxamide synthase